MSLLDDSDVDWSRSTRPIYLAFPHGKKRPVSELNELLYGPI